MSGEIQDKTEQRPGQGQDGHDTETTQQKGGFPGKTALEKQETRSFLFENCHFNEARGIFEASPLLALEDLQALGRNTHLIDDNSIEEAVNDYTGYIQKQQN